MAVEICNATGLYNATSTWSELLEPFVVNASAPCNFTGEACVNGLYYLYNQSVLINSTGTSCNATVVEGSIPLLVSSIAGTFFFLFWAGIGGWALWWAHNSVEKRAGELAELKDIQTSIVKSRLAVFEGDDQNELTGFETSIKIYGDAQCIAAEQELKWGRRQIFTWSHGDGGPSKRPAPDGGVGYYFLGKEGKLLRSDDEDPEFKACNRALWELGYVEAASADADTRNLRQYLTDAGVTERFLGLADAGYW